MPDTIKTPTEAIMHIVHIAAELAPIAKVGGLADVLLGLSRELSWKKHDVDIIIPKYDCMDIGTVRDLGIDTMHLYSPFENNWFDNTIWMGWVENLKVYFIHPHHPKLFFDRGCFYGCEDDIDRYSYFSRAALEFMYKKGLQPDIIHIHDWQTALIAPLLKTMYRPLGMTKPKLVMTMHNLEYQGLSSPDCLEKVGLKSSDFTTPEKLQDAKRPELVNLLKGAIVYSDFLTTVSPTYAKEILTPDGGKGLEKVLSENQGKLKGILNGLDYSFWNPEIDRYLPATFSPRDIPNTKKDTKTFDQKGYNKHALRRKLGMDEAHKPLVGCICRLVPQKGVDLIRNGLFHTLEKGGQFVLLGSSPIPEISAEFHALKRDFADHPDVEIILFHQEELAHQIYASSDIIVVPSIFEPCGLTQLIALKYGAIPVVRRTGGLADTVFDFDDLTVPEENRCGYVFEDPTDDAFAEALDRAFETWFKHPDVWHKNALHGMQIDHSWNQAADEYVTIYKQLGGIP